MATFDLLAAIDLRGGRVVRLREGDFARETVYSDDPVEVAERFVDAGARWLHVVDLDGARDGNSAHAPVIRRIVDAVGERASVEVAGGLRTQAAVRAALEAGASRAVVGTAALADPAVAAALVKAHGASRIVASLDVRDGLAVGRGWVAGAPGTPVVRAIAVLIDAGIGCLEVTSIKRDGSLEGPDLELLASVVRRAGETTVIASGGIRTVEDLLATRNVGCAGAIVGRAIYEGTLELGRAVRAME